MACILRLECNFFNGYFRCQLPLETVDIEVKINTMKGIHTFQRDRTTQLIKCNPWSTRFHPFPSLIQKMKTYVELEGKLGPKPRPQPQTQPQPSTSAPPQNNNPMTRKAPGPKMSKKKKGIRVPAKRRHKVRVIAQPIPTTPTAAMPVDSTPTVPTPTVATTSTKCQW